MKLRSKIMEEAAIEQVAGVSMGEYTGSRENWPKYLNRWLVYHRVGSEVSLRYLEAT